jgi:antitoxin CptB
MIGESPDVRLRRLRMRSSRRGMLEMDLILGGFAAQRLDGLFPTELDAYEAVLSENDQDLYQWVSGQGKTPETHCWIVDRIRSFLAGN